MLVNRNLILSGIFLVLCSILTAGCSSQQPEQSKTESAEKLRSYRGFPPGVEGCSCYFSVNEQEFRKEHYLFVSDLESKAYIRINNRDVALKRDSTTRRNEALDDSNYTEYYSNGVYSLQIDVRFEGNTGDEVWWNTGELILFFKGLEIDRRGFVGECGC